MIAVHRQGVIATVVLDLPKRSASQLSLCWSQEGNYLSKVTKSRSTDLGGALNT